MATIRYGNRSDLCACGCNQTFHTFAVSFDDPKLRNEFGEWVKGALQAALEPGDDLAEMQYVTEAPKVN